LVLPSGTVKIGKREYDVLINGSTDTIQALNKLPVKQVNGATIYVRDIANVRDGYTPQVNMVVSNGIKAALLPVLKNGGASTLEVVSRIRKALPQIAATLPRELQIKPLFDQSVFVSSALHGAMREGIIAASLTAVMILLFLGSWRSTLVVATSIPLSLCFSVVIGAMVSAVVFSLVLVTPFLGEDFFPNVDAGQFRLHVSAPVGTRIEVTQEVFYQVENVIRSVIPEDQIDLIIQNIGLPMNLNLALSDTATISSADGEIDVSLNPARHGSTFDYLKKIHEQLIAKYPNYTYFSMPADIVSQILNAGLPAPIDVQVVGHDPKNYQIAQELRQRIAQVPGAVDVNVHQVIDNPSLLVNIDRTRADQLGLTEKQIADDLLISLAGSGQTAPNFWLNPQNGVSYSIVVQTPQHLISSTSEINLTPIMGANSILIDSKGPRVLVVDSFDKIHVKPVTLGRDFGTTEILGGLDPTDRVVQNPTEALHEGMIVSVERA
jgi:multidrug efflux pump subunit AcrB